MPPRRSNRRGTPSPSDLREYLVLPARADLPNQPVEVRSRGIAHFDRAVERRRPVVPVQPTTLAREVLLVLTTGPSGECRTRGTLTVQSVTSVQNPRQGCGRKFLRASNSRFRSRYQESSASQSPDGVARSLSVAASSSATTTFTRCCTGHDVSLHACRRTTAHQTSANAGERGRVSPDRSLARGSK